MQGSTVCDCDHGIDDAATWLSTLVREGTIKYREHIVDGAERAPQAFIDLFGGGDFGKSLLRLAQDDGSALG